MNKHPKRIHRFEDMTVWQQSKELAVFVHKQITAILRYFKNYA